MWHRSCGTSRAVAPLHVPVTPVSRRSMSTARIGARPITEFAPLWLLCLLWLFFQFHWNPLLAWADETSPPPPAEATPPPSNAAAKIELSANAEAPETGGASAPAPKMVADSIATAAPAVRDSSAKAPDAPGSPAKEGQPAENTRAIKLFTSALDFQSDSREAAKVRQYARAERLTLAARDFADRASRMVGPPREDPDYVEHVLRRTDDALERAKDVLRTGA